MLSKVEIQKAIGNRIRVLREERNIPQQDLAGLCNMEKSNFSRLESGRSNPTIYTLSLIADKLDVSLNELVNF